MSRLLSRRELLKAAAVTAGVLVLAGCEPATVEKEVTRVVEKEVEVPVTAIVEQTVLVEGEEKVVTQVVEKVVTSTPAPVPPMTLTTWNIPPATGIPDDDALIPTRINKEFNVNIVTWWLEGATWIDQLATRAAGGEFVDFGYLDRDVFMDAGMVGHIALSDFATFCPKFFKALAEWDNGSWECFHGGLWDGVRYSYGTYTVSQTYGRCGGYRKDTLDKLGLDVPTTIEEQEEVLKAIRDSKLHPYATAHPGTPGWANWMGVCGSFGTKVNSYIRQDDGTIINGWVHPGYREAMKTVSRWWEEGLINPISLTLDRTDGAARWCRGEWAFEDSRYWYNFSEGGELYDCIKASGGDVVLAPPPTGPDGYCGYSVPELARWGYQIGRQVDAEPDKKVKILELIEGTASDKDMATFCQYGEVGVHSYRDEATGALYRKSAEELPIPPTELGVTLLTATTPQIQMDFLGERFANEVYPMLAKSNIPGVADLYYFADTVPCQEYTELSQIQDLWSLDFMSGAKSAEADWDEFVNTFMEKGGQCLTDQYNKAFITMESTKAAISAEVKALLAGM